MAKKKLNYTPYLVGLGALAAVGFIFKDEIKTLFKPKEDTTTDETPEAVIEQVVTNSGVIPVASSVTAGLNALNTPKDRLNMNQYLKYGDKGQEIAKLQQILNRIAKITGKPKIQEDGVWGSGTEARLKNMFGDLSQINLYKMYIALFAIYAADKGKALKKWFSTYQTYLASEPLRTAARNEYFKKNAII